MTFLLLHLAVSGLCLFKPLGCPVDCLIRRQHVTLCCCPLPVPAHPDQEKPEPRNMDTGKIMEWEYYDDELEGY